MQDHYSQNPEWNLLPFPGETELDELKRVVGCGSIERFLRYPAGKHIPKALLEDFKLLDYEQALSAIWLLMDAPAGSPEEVRLDKLANFVCAYERGLE